MSNAQCYVVYNSTTGAIASFGHVSDPSMLASIPLSSGQAVLATDQLYRNDTYQVNVAAAPPVIEPIPSGPTPLPAAIAAFRQYQAKLAAGIAVTCTSNAALSATYALDDTTMNQVGSLARDCASGMGLPTGWIGYPDIAGNERALDAATVVELYKAQRDLIFAMQTTLAILGGGGSANWPAQSATIA